MTDPFTASPFARVAVAAIVGASVAASSLVLSRSLVSAFQIKHAEKRITVTGSATKRIRSDRVVWRAQVKSQAADLASAHRKLVADVPEVLAFIKAHGIPENEIKVSAASVVEIHPRDTKSKEPIPEVTIAFVTEETIEVASAEIDKVETISREATNLIEKGVYITSEAPLYIYTNLAELKLKMLADASKDARERATQIATNAGSRVLGLIVARMGVMQVNPAYSTEVSSEGNNDRSSLDKDAMAIVTASFAID